MTSTTDEELVALAIASGDQQAFGELVRRHQGRVRNWLRQLTRDPAQADDLSQETFIKAWDRLNTFSGRGRFASWLMKLAYNEFLQAVRRDRRRSELDERYEADAAVLADTGDRRGADAGSEVPDLPRMLAVLGEEERHVMLLGYGCGYSHGEISEITGMPVGTVKSHMHRGKQRIRETFGLDGNS